MGYHDSLRVTLEMTMHRVVSREGGNWLKAEELGLYNWKTILKFMGEVEEYLELRGWYMCYRYLNKKGRMIFKVEPNLGDALDHPLPPADELCTELNDVFSRRDVWFRVV